MPLFKGCGCKGKPAKAIDYITDEKKAAIVTSYALDDNRDYARQFAETAKLFGKAQKYDSRKYYHFKHSFDPKDNISPKEAHHLTEELAQQAGTIPYELTCAVSKRVPRVYLQNGCEVERELLLRF